MKKILTLIAGLSFLLALSASADPWVGNGFAYLTSGATAGADATWYNLSGTDQAQSFDGANLGNFESYLWLGGQTEFWTDGNGDGNTAKMNYSITGAAEASGIIDYAYQSTPSSNDQWGTDINGANTSDISVDLISTHNLKNGNYNIAVWVEANNTVASAWDSNGGSNYNASFTVVPEPATMGLLGLGGLLTLLVRRIKIS